MVDSLSNRLKALRSAQHGPPAGDKSTLPAATSATALQTRSSNAGPSRPAGSSEEDDVERLIRMTDDELALEGSSHAPLSDEGTGHGGLLAVEQEDDEDWEAADPPVSNSKDDHLLLGQARRLLDKAERLQHSSQPIQGSAGLLKEQRKKPLLLHRGSSNKDPQRLLGDEARDSGDESEALARDLADALGEDGMNHSTPSAESESLQQGHQISEQVINSSPPPPRRNEIQGEVDALLTRFAALRSIKSPSSPGIDLPPLGTQDKTTAVPPDGSPRSTPSPRLRPSSEAEEDTSSFLSLPSVPLSEPHSMQAPAPKEVASTSTTLPPAHPTLGPTHSDIPPDLDLTPFRRLVGRDLDVRRLGDPRAASSSGGGEGAYLPWKKRQEKDRSTTETSQEEREEEEEMFCSICSLPPTLICFSPQDPEGEGCMADMYCSACWVQAHEGMQREELRDHRTKDLHRSRKGGGRRSGRGGGGGGGGHEGGNRRKPMLA